MYMRSVTTLVVAFCVSGALAPPARADDEDLRARVDALQKQVREQERKFRELEGHALTQDEVAVAVERYLATAPSSALFVGGAGEGKAGFPRGKRPFIEEGPNRLEVGFRNQVRYEAFLYSNRAKGTLADTGNPYSAAAPRDRSGFEIERLFLEIAGSIFCKDITYFMQFDFDTDSGSGIQKRYAYLDWKYAADEHVRAGADRVPFGYEPNNSDGMLAFVDRSIVGAAFDLGWSTGVEAWGQFGDCVQPRRFLYRVQAGNGEGRMDEEGGAGLGSVFNQNAFGTYADSLLYAGMFEWNVVGSEYPWDEVDLRPCDQRHVLHVAVGTSAYHEDDDDSMHNGWGGLVLRSTGRATRTGLNAWIRSEWQGWSFVAEGYGRSVDYTAGSTAPTQTDIGAAAVLHYRFADSNWGVGVRASAIWLDDDYRSVTVGPAGNTTTLSYGDTISELGAVVTYFFWDHNNKIMLDVNHVWDNSGVSSTSVGYLVNPGKGVIVEDGLMIRVQWQIAF